MDIRNSSGALDNILLQILQNRSAQTNNAATTQTLPPPKAKARAQDIVSLSTSTNNQNNGQNNLNKNQTRLISEDTTKLENGFRRTQKFESGDGRQFTRIEEFTTSNDRSKRIVLQQNNSGSTTVLENIIDRQEDGSFRLTQRFTNENGETNTNIEFNVTPNNRDIILGRAPDPEQQNDKPFQILRGTQFDQSA